MALSSCWRGNQKAEAHQAAQAMRKAPPSPPKKAPLSTDDAGDAKGCLREWRLRVGGSLNDADDVGDAGDAKKLRRLLRAHSLTRCSAQ